MEFIRCGEVTLPLEASPFLNFGKAARPVPLWEAYGLPSERSGPERERLGSCRMIGSDGCGNPLCIEQASGAVVLSDHEDRFRTRQFVNAGVRQLAECLLAYMGEHDADRFRAAVRTIDPAACAPQSFWWHEANRMADAAADGGM